MKEEKNESKFFWVLWNSKMQDFGGKMQKISHNGESGQRLLRFQNNWGMKAFAKCNRTCILFPYCSEQRSRIDNRSITVVWCTDVSFLLLFSILCFYSNVWHASRVVDKGSEIELDWIIISFHTPRKIKIKAKPSDHEYQSSEECNS